MDAQLDLIGIVVADMTRSIAFYRELGVDFPEEGGEHVEATLPGGLRIALDAQETVRSFDPDWRPAVGGPQMALAFRLDNPAEVDAAYAQLVGSGHKGHKEPWDAPWGMRYALMRDPDGNAVDLFAPL